MKFKKGERVYVHPWGRGKVKFLREDGDLGIEFMNHAGRIFDVDPVILVLGYYFTIDEDS